MQNSKVGNFSKGDKVEHFLHGKGEIISIISGGTVDVKFGNKHVYVQAINLKNLNSLKNKEKKIKRKLAKIAREKSKQRSQEESNQLTNARLKRIREEKQAKLVLEEEAKVKSQQIKDAFCNDFLNADSFYNKNCTASINLDRYNALKIKFIQNWFAQKLPNANAPDNEQALAIATLNGNVQVIARAGSGKTTTLVWRAFFLIEHCGIDPTEILLLAFNRKAALEVKARLIRLLSKSSLSDSSSEIELSAVNKIIKDKSVIIPYVMTFHALAYAIVHPEEAPLHDNENDLSLSRLTQQIIDDYLNDGEQYKCIKELMMTHFKADWMSILEGGYHYKNKQDEFLAHRRSLPTQSLKGEYVKSYGEKLIADFLFQHDVNYRYERNHHWSGINYRPDFTLFSTEKSGLIIEYFGLSGEPDYDAMSEQKKRYWKAKKNWSLLAYTPSDISSCSADDFSSRLKSEIEAFGFSCQKLTEEEIWLRCKERAIDRFTGVMVNFVGRCRKLSLSYNELVQRCNNYKTCSIIEAKFLSFGKKLYKNYLSTLENTGDNDFDGLIQKSTILLNTGHTRFKNAIQSGDLSSVKYISIDEYQDFSLLFNDLIQSILKNTTVTSLFCVGDDWQAINGFAGSDLQYFKEIQKFVHAPKKLKMTTNYRSPDNIVQLGNKLMLGLGPQATSHKTGLGEVRLVDLDTFHPTRVEQERHAGDIITPVVLRLINQSLHKNQDVVLLCRRNSISGYVNELASSVNLARFKGISRYLEFIRSFFPKAIRERITTSTTHKYKGLEKPTVVVMDLFKRSYPLVHPDWVFHRVFGDCLQSIIDEEQRLLYVALTRAEKDLFIITSTKEASPFLQKLNNIRPIAPISWQTIPPLIVEGQIRKLTVKVSNYNAGYEQGTFAIKDLLKACGYKWQSTSRSWVKVFLEEKYSLDVNLKEIWVENARYVKVTVFNDEEQQVMQHCL